MILQSGRLDSPYDVGGPWADLTLTVAVVVGLALFLFALIGWVAVGVDRRDQRERAQAEVQPGPEAEA